MLLLSPYITVGWLFLSLPKTIEPSTHTASPTAKCLSPIGVFVPLSVVIVLTSTPVTSSSLIFPPPLPFHRYRLNTPSTAHRFPAQCLRLHHTCNSCHSCKRNRHNKRLDKLP